MGAGSMMVSDQYPGVKLGFSTQNFLNCLPVGVDNLATLLDFAADEGYAFIELRDPAADLSLEDCKVLAAYSREKDVEVIYEIHKDLFNPEFKEVFDRAVRNTAVFGKPGILRSIMSWSEFTADEDKTGWNREELDHLAGLADECAAEAKELNVQFVLENIIEPWFGNDGGHGLADLFRETSGIGLQFDTANPFLPSCRGVADPDDVAEHLEQIADRWITTHLKCGKDGAFQPVLEENPMPYQKIFGLMSGNQVQYAALELLSVEDKQECFDNHQKSIEYLASLGIVEVK
jgi:sugar phosphate isomerase/epimerase